MSKTIHFPRFEVTDSTVITTSATVTTIAHGNHAIHTKKWSYIHYYDGSEELYNIVEDPEEWENLATIPEFGGIIEKLKKYIPKDRYKQFARYGHWKACVLNSGEIELYYVHEGAGTRLCATPARRNQPHRGNRLLSPL